MSGTRVFGDDVINERARDVGVEESSDTEEEDEVECVPETEPQFVDVPGTDMNDGPEDQYNFEDLQQPTQTQVTQMISVQYSTICTAALYVCTTHTIPKKDILRRSKDVFPDSCLPLSHNN